MTTDFRVSALILAAGASSRMGAPKALLSLGGMTALRRVTETMLAGGAADAVVVLGHEAERIRAGAGLSDSRVRFVINEGWQGGQTTSIQRGLRAIVSASPPPNGFALALVDMPLVWAETVRALMAAFTALPGGESILLPRHAGRRGHPAFFRMALAGEFLALGAADPGHSVTRRDAGRVAELDVDDAGVVLGINTPEEYRRALRMVELGTGGSGERDRGRDAAY
ncbi:MAG: nucleotidyltransferase family protein [Planctomycetes bacterium]|nr:nucleotidyltransferase family protein [Planctomycetota bacterium]